ncbi:MAG: sigma-70 family RNA polymerase sigma factor [Planctomycetes bacterium]|nr:sigma-70 family RNA polymerase sigma factor [Planctomycetota bacterium]
MPTYESLVRDHHALAFKVARSILRDDAAAEDAVQDVYLHFIKNPGALSGAENLRAFVARAAVNRALDLKRGAGRREQHERASLSGRADMNPVEAASRAELRAKVAELPEEQRLAIEMHYFHGLTKEETAHALQVASGTVSSRLNAALGRLRTALAGAAFVGVLAMLESELAECAAEAAVPEGMSERLMRLATSNPPPSATSTSPLTARRAGITVAATAAALFLALGAARLIRPGRTDTALPFEIASGTPESQPHPAAPSKDGEDPSAPKIPSSVANATADPDIVEAILEGFLFRRDSGLYVEEVRADDYMPKQISRSWDQQDEMLWKESLTLPADGALAGLPAATKPTFGTFMLKDGDPAEAPRTRVKLSIRGAKRHSAVQSDSPATKVPYLTYAPQRVELVAVLEKEVLSPAWLLAWRDRQRAGTELGNAWALEPGTEKRSRVLEAATKLAQALERARAARADEACTDWHIRREAESSAGAEARLRGVGLDRLLPSWPAPDELHDALMNAASAEGLRTSIVSRWGEDALRLDAGCYRARSDGFGWSQISIPEVLRMDDAAFASLKKELESIPDNRPHPAEAAGMEARHRDEHARVAAAGLEVADLSSLDREHFILDCGARVVSVAAGSDAEKAGLRVGDIVWKAVVTIESKTGRTSEPIPVNGESGLAFCLKSADNQEVRVLAVQVVREEGVTSLQIGK